LAKQPKFTDEIPGTEFNSAREFLPPSRCGLVSNKVDAASNEIFRYDENLLVTNWVAEAWKSEFVYDARFRRRIERDYGWSGGSWTLTNETRFIYDGNVVIQHRAANNLPSQILTRGTDLSGTFQVAGGIGAWNSTRRPMHQSCHEILRWRGFSAYEPARAR